MTRSLQISLRALRHNAALLRDLVGNRRAAFVLKGNAYGHGLVPAARAVEPFATRLCVYTLEEALALRDAGIGAPLLVLGPVPSAALDEALAADIELALWNRSEFTRRICRAAANQHRPAAVHIKVNTDLNRLGFEPHDLHRCRRRALALPGDFDCRDLLAPGVGRGARLAVHDASVGRVRTGARARCAAARRPSSGAGSTHRRLRRCNVVAADSPRYGAFWYRALRIDAVAANPRSNDRRNRWTCDRRSRTTRSSLPCARLQRARRSATAAVFTRRARCASASFRPVMPTACRARSPIAAPSSSTARSARSSDAWR